jgi:hypothetical protein
MYSVISIVLFGVFMTEARSGTGILFQLDDDWCIDYFRIRNPHSFPHVLIPENIGKEVHYIHSTRYPELAYWPPFIYVFTLDLVPVFINKQFILYICIITIFSIALPYFYLNRKRFQFTNKLLG